MTEQKAKSTPKNQVTKDALEEYNKAMGKVFKRNFVFKNKREIFFANSKSQFEEVSSYVLNGAQVKMFNLNQAVISGSIEN